MTKIQLSVVNAFQKVSLDFPSGQGHVKEKEEEDTSKFMITVNCEDSDFLQYEFFLLVRQTTVLFPRVE